MKDKAMRMCCESHMRKMGVCVLILGLAVLANVYWEFVRWGIFAAAVLIIAGLWKLLKPISPCK